MSDQIQGLPPGAIVGPPLQSQPPANQVEGLPPGAIVGPALQPDQTSAEPSFWDKTKHALGQVFSATPEGAGSATSGAGAPELATQFKKDVEASEGPENKLTGAGVIVGGAKSAMEVPQTIGHFIAPNTFSAHPEALETKGTAETAGKIGENILEFMAGDAALKNLNLGARFAKLGKIATLLEEHPVLAKAVEIGGNALRTGTVTGTQTLAHGGTAEEALQSGAVGGVAGEVMGEGVPFVAKKLGSVLEKYAPDFMNSLMRAKKGSFLYGKNPGQAIIDEGINAPKSITLAGQLENIHGQLEAAGENLDSQIKQTLSQPSVAAKKQDIVPFIQNTIQDAKQKIVSETGIDTQSYLSELDKLEESILTRYNTDGEVIGNIKGARLSPAEISDVKKSIGKNTQWKVFQTDPQYKLKSEINKVRQSLYGGLKEMVENAAEEGAPGSKIGDLNARYANVIEAQGLLENRIAYEHGTGGWAAAVRKGEWGSALLGIFSGNPIAQAGGAAFLANRVARSAPGSVLETRGAAAVGKAMQSPVAGQASQAVKPAIANWARVQFANGDTHEIHGDDVDKALQQNPGAKVVPGQK